MHREVKTRVPVITIGGFLGAGKTTLINRLLSEAGTDRIVVFVNDFGAINIDYDLIETADSNRISLKNGCVCCTLNNDLIGSIQGFIEEEMPPAAFVIEASGVADPRALDNSILLLQQAGTVRLDNRIYLVDAEQFHQSAFDDKELIIDHAAASDCIVLNKADLVSDDALKDTFKTLKSANPHAVFVETIHANCPSELILQGSAITDVPQKLEKLEPVNHHHGFVSWSHQTDRLIDRERFEAFVKHLPEMCFRAKGQICFGDDERNSNTFHLVGRRATIEQKPNANRQVISTLVAIGKTEQMDLSNLEAAFERVLIGPTSGH